MSKQINMELINQTTFGVEIETACISRESAARVAAGVFGTNIVKDRRECGYGRFSAYDSEGREWAFVSDSSIQDGHGSRDRFGGCELNTPPLTYERDIELLQNVIRALRNAGAKSGPEYGCGIHVHVSGAGHTPKTVSNFVNLIYSNYDLVSKSLGITEGRRHWCMDFSDGMMNDLDFANAFKKAVTFDKQADVWYDNFARYQDRNAHYNGSRYHLLNLHRFFSTLGKPSNTIEIRAFNATLHAGAVRAYVLLVLSMNASALTQKNIKAEKNPIMLAGNEKFAMRTWLNRMGWTGETFKNPHKLFIERLNGNSAWRFGKNGDLYR